MTVRNTIVMQLEMKKRVLVLTILLSGVLVGCNSEKNSTKDTQVSVVESSMEVSNSSESEAKTNEATEGASDIETTVIKEISQGEKDSKEAETIENDINENEMLEKTGDYEEIYQEVLDKMHRIIAHPESSAWDEDDGAIAIVEAANYQESALQNIGYAFEDLSGDGVCELIIGNRTVNSCPGNTILAVYTYHDGNVVYSFGGPSRNPHFLMGDGRILFYASNGYMSYGFGLSTLNKDGTTLTCEELVYTGIGPYGETQVVFENKEGFWDEDSAYLSDMTLEDYENYWESYLEKTQYVYLTPFSEYTHPDGFVGVEEIYPVYISYADESILDECEHYIIDDNEYSKWISIYANTEVTNFYVLGLADIEYFDDGTFTYSTKEKVECKALNQGKEILVKMDLPETFPFYAISYFEEDGTFHSYAIIISGEDGSVKLMNLNN